MLPGNIMLLTVCLMLLGSVGLCNAAAPAQPERVPELTVHGEASLQVPADQMRITVGVVTHGVTAEAALEDNTDKMGEVEKALQRAGLGKEEYRTGFFQIEPKWEIRPRQAAWDWKPGITGYIVRNSFKVVSRQIKLTGKIIEAATSAGANDIQALTFDLADPRHSRAAAIEQATANARADAVTLAAAAGVELIRVLSLQLDGSPAAPMRVEMRPMAFDEGMAAGASPPITAGDVTVGAGVHLVYEIGRGTQ